MKLLCVFLIVAVACSSSVPEAFVVPGARTEKFDPRVIMGTYCGECIHNCFHAYCTNNGKAYQMISDHFPKNDSVYNWMVLPDSVYKKVKAAEDAIPSNISMYESPIGCPDCRDQCGVFVRIHDKMITRNWNIDPDAGKHPKEFDTFVGLIYSTRW